MAEFDSRATMQQADKLAAKIKAQFNVSVETTANDDGSVTLVANNDNLAPRDNGSPSTITVKNFNDAIDKEYREFRNKGWRFDQPRGGTFTIGIKEDVDEDYYGADGGGIDVNQVFDIPAVADTSMTIGTPASTQPAKNITVYAQSISPISYGTDDAVVAFDVIFTVGIACDDSTKTYQVVKRIGIDRAKIAADAEATVPVSIVESKPAAAVGKKINEAFSTARMRKLAGLS